MELTWVADDRPPSITDNADKKRKTGGRCFRRRTRKGGGREKEGGRRKGVRCGIEDSQVDRWVV